MPSGPGADGLHLSSRAKNLSRPMAQQASLGQEPIEPSLARRQSRKLGTLAEKVLQKPAQQGGAVVERSVRHAHQGQFVDVQSFVHRRGA